MISAVRFILRHAHPSLNRSLRSFWREIKRMLPPPVPVRGDWSIGIYRGPSPFCLAPAESIQNPVLTTKDVIDVPAGFVADPFMITIAGTWHMLFEINNLESKKGEIGLATSKDGLKWDYKQVVLAEPFHLSYPYVFEWQGEVFMVPESSEENSIRLYRADPFPFRWSFVATLVTGKEYVDPSLARFRDKWYLFTSTGTPESGRAENLHLFVAEDLTGPWLEHPCSPVVRRNARISRPGGRVISFRDTLYRYTQDCAKVYGRQVYVFEIIELTPYRYADRMVSDKPILKQAKNGWNQMGMHHIDPHQLPDGSWIACVDGWRLIRAES
jgi:hypothetical protein